MAAAQSIPTSGTPVPGMASYDQIITALMTKYQIPGGAVAVARNGKLVFARGYGYANRSTNELVQPDSAFRIASLSKAITSAAVLLLVQRGRLDLDAKVFDILTNEQPLSGATVVDQRLYNITIRQLLQHAGGWNRDTTFDPMFRPLTVASAAHVASPPSTETIIRYMMAEPLQFAPGTDFNYSNYGYALLGRVIEKVTGKHYETFVHDEVLSLSGAACMHIGHTLQSQPLPKEVKYLRLSRRIADAIRVRHWSICAAA
jgi:N-acyl-D-amino-acid deacylase